MDQHGTTVEAVNAADDAWMTRMWYTIALPLVHGMILWLHPSPNTQGVPFPDFLLSFFSMWSSTNGASQTYAVRRRMPPASHAARFVRLVTPAPTPS